MDVKGDCKIGWYEWALSHIIILSIVNIKLLIIVTFRLILSFHEKTEI